jgi:hypothetical protein|tara:strand:- start:2185 stop:2502 length:318 start_codon:yes stop_codon:yes gene_type:complete
MQITRELKYATFEWDDEAKTFTIIEEDGNRVILNKVYAFAFMRFVTSVAQRNWFRKAKPVIKEKKAFLADSGQFVFDEALALEEDTLEALRTDAQGAEDLLLQTR